MITSASGDILLADCEAIVNAVNCVGVMGRGLALQFKRAHPDNFKIYQAACKRGEVQPGRMLIVETKRTDNPRFIVNFPTKQHWKGRSRIEDIRSGLIALVEEVKRRGIQSIAIPPLGCGLGGLDWAEVKPLIEAAFSVIPDLDVQVYEPVKTS